MTRGIAVEFADRMLQAHQAEIARQHAIAESSAVQMTQHYEDQLNRLRQERDSIASALASMDQTMSRTQE